MGCQCGRDALVREDIRDKYRIGRVLGSGAFGQVRECTDKLTKEVRAVKLMEKKVGERGPWSNESMFKREVGLLAEIEHPNIIRFYDFYEDAIFLYAVMEKCEGGELFDRIIKRRKFTEGDGAILCRQMLLALQHIHSLGIVHRDVKAENFLFLEKSDDSPLKLIDFGMSAKLEPGEVLVEVCGSPHYLAPDVIKRKYDQKADMWALGVLIYLMLYGKYPYDGNGSHAIVKEIMTKRIDWQASTLKHSANAVHFMQSLLDPRPAKRPSAAEALKHPWITSTYSAHLKRFGGVVAGQQEPQPISGTSPAAAAGGVPLIGGLSLQESQAAQKLSPGGGIGQDKLGDLPPASASPQPIPIDVIRSAHRKVTMKKTAVPEQVEARRNEALKRLELNWTKGRTKGRKITQYHHRHRRVGYASGRPLPEYSRPDRRFSTTPSRFFAAATAGGVRNTQAERELAELRAAAAEAAKLERVDEEDADEHLSPTLEPNCYGRNGQQSSDPKQRRLVELAALGPERGASAVPDDANDTCGALPHSKQNGTGGTFERSNVRQSKRAHTVKVRRVAPTDEPRSP